MRNCQFLIYINRVVKYRNEARSVTLIQIFAGTVFTQLLFVFNSKFIYFFLIQTFFKIKKIKQLYHNTLHGLDPQKT